MKSVRAIFIGKDGPCSFRKGHEYYLDSEILNNKIYIRAGGFLCCFYSSLGSFLNNWKIIQE